MPEEVRKVTGQGVEIMDGATVVAVVDSRIEADLIVGLLGLRRAGNRGDR